MTLAWNSKLLSRWAGAIAWVGLLPWSGQQIKRLKFDNQTGSFYNGKLVVGETSGATGTVFYVDVLNSILYLNNISGTFQDNEIIHESVLESNLITNPEFTINTNGWSVAAGDGAILTRRDFTVSPNIDPTGGLDDFGLELKNGEALIGYGHQQNIAVGVNSHAIVTMRCYCPSSNITNKGTSFALFDSDWNTIVSQTYVTVEDVWQDVGGSFTTATAVVHLLLFAGGDIINDVSYFDAITIKKYTNAALANGVLY